jgi:hypothetical protein
MPGRFAVLCVAFAASCSPSQLFAACGWGLGPRSPSLAQVGLTPSTSLSDTEKEAFLRGARIVSRRQLPVGITEPERATLTDGRLTHDAHIQTIDSSSRRYHRRKRRWVALRESYQFNIAAYRLNRLLGLDMVPVSVERSIDGRPAAVTWWVDDVLMMESGRRSQGAEPPDPAGWQDQMHQVRVFQTLIHNTDPNPANLLITTDWRLWMVDFTRAFRTYRHLPEPELIERIDRRLYRGLRALSLQALRREMEGLLTAPEVNALIARRNLLLDLLERRIAARGEAAVICDLPGH